MHPFDSSEWFSCSRHIQAIKFPTSHASGHRGLYRHKVFDAVVRSKSYPFNSRLSVLSRQFLLQACPTNDFKSGCSFVPYHSRPAKPLDISSNCVLPVLTKYRIFVVSFTPLLRSNSSRAKVFISSLVDDSLGILFSARTMSRQRERTRCRRRKSDRERRDVLGVIRAECADVVDSVRVTITRPEKRGMYQSQRFVHGWTAGELCESCATSRGGRKKHVMARCQDQIR